MNFNSLQQFMDTLNDNYKVPGASVAVIYGGAEVFRTHVGVRNETGEPVDDNTLFRWYSMSKPITVTAALQLFEKGLYKLEDPVSKYLPSFKDMTVTLIKPSGAYGWWNPPAKNILTIKHLFTMTAGITYGGMYHPAEIFTSQNLEKLYKETDGKYTTRQFADMIGNTPLMFEPGTHWNYSFCLDVLGALVEVWSGQNFYEYLKDNIFEPLGMKDVHFYLPEEKKERLIDFWEINGDIKNKKFTETTRPFCMGKLMESGGAGLIGSLDDYLKFAWALANKGLGANNSRILLETTIDLMRTNHLDDKVLPELDWETLKGYGYGLGVRTLIEKDISGARSNIGEFGWNGMAGTYMLADPEKKLAIVYMQQMYPSREEKIQSRLRDIVYECLETK